MGRVCLFSFALMFIASTVFAPGVFAQCQSRVLVSPASDGPMAAKYAVSIATLDHHCLTGGQFTVSSAPPGSVVFENGIDSFFDIFLEVSTDHYVKEIGLTPTAMPGIPFQMITQVTYYDPWYPPETRVEDCWVNPATGNFEFFAPAPIPESVPSSMAMGQAECFIVAHKVYRIPLSVPGPGLRPCISITPGCLPEDNCADDPSCTPGGENDFRADVYKEGEQWLLEFEYSNEMIQPVCYCVFYYMAWPEMWNMLPLIGLDERKQTVTLSGTALGGAACGMVELFSYPPGAEIGALPGGNQFNVIGERQVICEAPVSRGGFQPGDEFYLVGFIDYSEMCYEAESDWVLERVRVTPAGTLEALDSGGECDLATVNVPREMQMMQSECITVCHDVYYIQLNTPANMMPVISITPGCNPPCVNPAGCVPGAMENCCYWIERIGTHRYLRFEYSNPDFEPVCYCVSFFDVSPIDLESNQLCAFDETTQSLRVSLWGSSPLISLSGSYQIVEHPLPAQPWEHIQSFFDIFMEAQTWDVPVPSLGHAPGEAFQLVTTFTFHNPGVPQSEYREWVVMNFDGTLSPYRDPEDPQCSANVPPLMTEGQSACFTVCHDIFEVQLFGPQGRPIINIVPGCDPSCPAPEPCVPGAPSDFMWWLTQSGLNWVLHFEYSNPFVQPVCYCVTYAGTEPVFEPHVLACWDENTQDMDVSVAVSNPSGLPANASGFINIYSVPAGVVVLPYPSEFSGVNEEWHHITATFDIPPIEPESFFDIWCEVQFTTPSLPIQTYREPIHTIGVPPDMWTENVDEGGECTATNIPPYGLYPGQSWCFMVCHDVYHVPIHCEDLPVVTITSGCFGPPQDNCEPWDCTPGGLWDYRYEIYWDESLPGYMLEFEYSNQNIEPACYCVSVAAPPCEPVDDLTIIVRDGLLLPHQTELNWTAPQAGLYTVYSTTMPNAATLPPSPDWIPEGEIYVTSGGPMNLVLPVGTDLMKFYVVTVDCSIAPARR